MNVQQYHVLNLRDTDTEGAIRRLCGNEKMYADCLYAFLKDKTMEELNTSINDKLWDEAFTAAHALKGVAGNMGFIPLMHNTGQLIVLIRGGRIHEIPRALEQVNSSYRDIIDGINQYFTLSDKKEQGDAI